MKERRRRKLMVEPPSSATGDIAFNLIVFFLVCASVQPDSGRQQTLPRSEQETEEQSENIEVQLARNTVMLNGNILRQEDFDAALKRALNGKTRSEDRVAVSYTHLTLPTKRIV